MKGPLYLMHSDVFLRYLKGTGMYFNCFGNFEIHAGSVGNLKKGPELSIFAVFATKGCLRPKWRFTKSHAFKYFSDLGWLLFQLFLLLFDTYRICQGLKRAQSRAFLPLSGLFEVPIKVPMYLMHSNGFPKY